MLLDRKPTESWYGCNTTKYDFAYFTRTAGSSTGKNCRIQDEKNRLFLLACCFIQNGDLRGLYDKPSLVIGGEENVNCTEYKIVRATFTHRSHCSIFLHRIGCFLDSVSFGWTVQTVRLFYRTQFYIYLHTVFSLVFHSYRMRIKTREDGLEYIHNNILESNVSSTATDFKSKIHPIARKRNILGSFNTLMCQMRQDETKFFNYFRT